MAVVESVRASTRAERKPLTAKHWFFAIVAAHLALQAILVTAVVSRGKPVDDLYRDLIAIGKLPLWSGMLSQVGGMAMSGAAAIGLFSYFAADEGRRQRFRYLFFAGALSAVLAIDDILLVHDGWLARLGVPEAATQATYGLAAAGFLVTFRGQLWSMDRLAQACLLAALGAMGCSAVADILLESAANLYLEEGSKQLGFVLWLLFVARAGACALNATQSGRQPLST